MVKKVKFSLEMANGVKVRTLDELKDNFDLGKILSYYSNGKLITWLNDRYYENEADQISLLDSDTVNFPNKLCEIFGLTLSEDHIADVEELERRNIRLTKLKQITDDKEIINNIDSIAFDQEEMADLLDEGITPIYLCGEKFSIPVSKCGITYIGIKNQRSGKND